MSSLEFIGLMMLIIVLPIVLLTKLVDSLKDRGMLDSWGALLVLLLPPTVVALLPYVAFELVRH